ncbi:MAG TPA: MASE1 domain-containing protein [Terriglobales bacterium]|jgi:PAS domain S-box-containing protein|nr:MASE1 domain-containing protein [Terriglobales bacterium]
MPRQQNQVIGLRPAPGERRTKRGCKPHVNLTVPEDGLPELPHSQIAVNQKDRELRLVHKTPRRELEKYVADEATRAGLEISLILNELKIRSTHGARIASGEDLLPGRVAGGCDCEIRFCATESFGRGCAISSGSIHFQRSTSAQPAPLSPRLAFATPSLGRYLLQFAVVFVVYFIAGKLGQATTNIRSSNLGPVWPAYGIALAAILICGYRIFPAVLSAAFLIAFLSPEPALTAVGQAAGATLAALTGTFLLRRLANFDNSISRVRDALAFVLLGGLVSAMVSASIGTLVLGASQVHPYSGLASAWLIYWLGDCTGALLVTPLVLSFPSLCRIRGWTRVAELLLLLAILVGACVVIFDDLPLVPVRMMAFAILPLIIWAAIRFGVGGASLSIFLVSTVATVETALGAGSFASSTPFWDGLQLDAFFTVLSLTGLTFAALYSERERAERERSQSLREQVAMEVRLQNEERLRGSEERLRLAQQAAHMGTFETNLKTGANTWNFELEQLYGLPRGGFGGTQAAFEDLLHPDDRAAVKKLIDQAMETGKSVSGEWRVIWPDGSVHWIAGHWQVFRDEAGAPLKMIGVNVDIADRKLSEAALAGMTQKLIEAQEQERSRIGRELHDDITQRLALLSLRMESVEGNPAEMQNSLPQFRKEVLEISEDVQALSHELHSSKLEYLGLAAAMKSWCGEFADRHKMEMSFTSKMSSDPPLPVGLALLRVLQEASSNASKHGRASNIDVQLWDDPSEVHLLVVDSGSGFDVGAASQGKGLGLTSMRERVRLLNGTISIVSKVGTGTAIHARIPRSEIEPSSLPAAS